VRAPVDHIGAPPFPRGLPWFNAAPLRMGDLLGRPVLIEFWDFCRPNSIRTLPYLRHWGERYPELQVIGVHASGFEPSGDVEAVRAAVARLGVTYPVVVDVELEIWCLYGNLGWPARYLFDQRGGLFDYHYGEGAYDETERAIQLLLGFVQPVVEPLRPEDAPGAVLAPQTADVSGVYCGPYEAGGVWAVLDGHGSVTVAGRELAVDGPGAYELISHPVSTAGSLSLAVSGGVRCYAVCFTPGLAESRLTSLGGRSSSSSSTQKPAR
jgi:thiol-disulfide isomerase/thioredoxin